MSATDWDAKTYARVASPQREWSKDVLARLDLVGDETVLDAGCGSGQVTAELLDLLPSGRVIAVDASPAMIEAATQHLAGSRVSFSCQDLSQLELEQPVDHAFSNATFHWIADHPKLFSHLHRAIRPGGRLSAQCGGAGNVARVVEAMAVVTNEDPFREYLGSFGEPWNFAAPDETKSRLRAAGFEDVDCWAEDRHATPEDPRAFLEASGLAAYRERLTPELFSELSRRLMVEMDHPDGFDYVRLNIKATRGDR